MDSNPYRHGSNFVDLLTSQQSVFSLVEETVPEDTPVERKERRISTPVEDMVHISSWLNTSKDPVVGNEQRSGAFWNRIAAYFAASPKVAATEHRESTHCKQRWHKINDQVNKFCGAFEAATREKTTRFGIVKNPARSWDKVKIGKIMRACIILHNMIVENERDGYTQFDVRGFQQGEDQGSSHVDLTYSTDIPSNITNMMGVRTRIRDTQKHQQLKDDLVEHIWRRFGGGEDNN
uniref:Myb-like domain-containing protein n=1 Tax=Brassica oleracea var. oleracea TaxID=109376 RepID=A0A0D3DV94_BRAOL